ncbi:hypothetical protein [Pseudanabaena sp. FACHB-2040]|uniref:hypothetical protein n=1 Tax=Pseudanabaena sp. FACHB-2040 TaxID=2692859 RepID=UPI001687DC39|nr:hypothetical protein [Pseudanabaena sp. FACHB-2040]MBD2256428.1 hypothetical protein [Pseudanabaena sp. FACHB-2040]
MSYRNRLYHWHIVRLLPQAQRITVARFRHRREAENHARLLRYLIPAGTFVILFEPPSVEARLNRSIVERS